MEYSLKPSPKPWFKKKAWAFLSHKAISKENYFYAKLHLLAIFSHEKVESMQFIQASLSSDVIFKFLVQNLDFLLMKYVGTGKTINLILDNSPMNHLVATKKTFVVSKELICFPLFPTHLFRTKSNFYLLWPKHRSKRYLPQTSLIISKQLMSIVNMQLKKVESKDLVKWVCSTLDCWKWVFDRLDSE